MKFICLRHGLPLGAALVMLASGCSDDAPASDAADAGVSAGGATTGALDIAGRSSAGRGGASGGSGAAGKQAGGSGAGGSGAKGGSKASEPTVPTVPTTGGASADAGSPSAGGSDAAAAGVGGQAGAAAGAGGVSSGSAGAAGVGGASAAGTMAAADGGKAAPTPATSDWLPDPNYKLVFADEFDGTAFDYSQWCTRLPYTDGPPVEREDEVNDPACTGPNKTAGTQNFLKKENQRYVVTNRLGEDTHVVSDGTLKLRATKTRLDDEYGAYESGLIRSRFSFVASAKAKYYMVSRVRVANVKGTFAAMWLVPGFGADPAMSWPPEIDIFEAALNEKDDTANMVRIGAHVSANGPQTKTGAVDFITYVNEFEPKYNNYRATQSLRDVWLTFSAEWTDHDVCYFVDGEQKMCENYFWLTPAGGPANAAQLIMNLAIGDEWAGRYGIDDTKIPVVFEIDYARIYSAVP